MRLPRFRVCTLLILVLLVGVGVWGCMMWQRSAEYRCMADTYAQMEQDEAAVVAKCEAAEA